MNVFATHSDPQVCASVLDDKRVVKMIVESCQLLSSTLHYYGIEEEAPYKNTHLNHPCTKWVRAHKENYKWLLLHFKYLIDEYEFRFHNIHHKCRQHIYTFDKYINRITFDNISTPRFINCSQFKEDDDIFSAYRKTLLNKWKNDKRHPRWYRHPINMSKGEQVLSSKENVIWFAVGKQRAMHENRLEEFLQEYVGT